jgi:hypothetical protein
MNQSQAAAKPDTGRRRWRAILAGCAVLSLLALCGAAVAGWRLLSLRPPAPSQPAVEYVLDTSARMALPADTGGGTRLAVAQSVLAEIIRPANPALTAGLRVFGTGPAAPGCTDTQLLVPLAPANQGKIADSLLAIGPATQPDAALGAAVVAALHDLAATRGPHTLVVVTGGSDSCNTQAGALIAAEAKHDGIDYQLFVIGFLVADNQGSAIVGLVDSSHGHYIRVSNRDQLQTVLQSIQHYVDNPATTVSSVLATAGAVMSQTAPAPATTTPPASTASLTTAPTPTATLAPPPTPSPTPNLAPKVNSFLARFDAVQRATFYSVTVSLETSTIAGTPPAFTYQWTNSNPCGEFIGVTSPVAEWRHPDVPGSCPNEPVHPGIITVVVSDAEGAVKCVYSGGSAPGNIAQCQVVPK